MMVANSTCQSSKVGGISVLYFNARSLLPKIDELRAISMSVKPHVICIVEFWLDDSIQDCEVSIENYNLVRLDRNRHGGGVLIYVIMSLPHKLVLAGSPDLVLSVSCSLSVITFCVFYRPPCTPALFLILF